LAAPREANLGKELFVKLLLLCSPGVVGRVVHLLTALDRIVYLPAVNRHFTWGFNSQAYLVSSDFYDNNSDIVVDNDALVFLSR